MVSAIDITKPTQGSAYTADVRANFAHAKSEIEALQSLPITIDTDGNLVFGTPAFKHLDATFGPDPQDQGVYGIVASGLNIMATNDNDTNVGAWLYTVDSSTKGTSGAGVGSGNANGFGTGEVWVWSGNVSAGPGNSGNVYLWSGDVADGRSGDAVVAVGAVHGSGTPGNIVLDGPMVKRSSSQWYAEPGIGGFDIECMLVDDTGAPETAADGIYLQSAYVNTRGKGGTIWFQAGDGGSSGGDGGVFGLQAGGSNAAGYKGGPLMFVGGQGQAPGAHGGDVGIQSGSGSGNGVSGIIEIHSGDADTNLGISGNVHIWTGSGANGGNIRMTTQPATTKSGDITIETGVAPTRGDLILGNTKTADPHKLGAVWADPTAGYALKVSQG